MGSSGEEDVFACTSSEGEEAPTLQTNGSSKRAKKTIEQVSIRAGNISTDNLNIKFSADGKGPRRSSADRLLSQELLPAYLCLPVSFGCPDLPFCIAACCNNFVGLSALPKEVSTGTHPAAPRLVHWQHGDKQPAVVGDA